jgi:hypothetical protein
MPFPGAKPRPTDEIDVAVPRSSTDMNVNIAYYNPDDAATACAQSDQTLIYGPDGSAFVIRVSPRSADVSLGAGSLF